MQDAADGTVISSAVIMARGMNFVALTSIIMEALVMIILILQLLVTVIALVAAILAACFMYPLAAAMLQIGYQVYDLSQQVQDIVFEILPLAHDLETIIRAVTPAVAVIDSVMTAKEDYSVVDFGFVIPPRLTLPLEEGTYSQICGRAGKDLVEGIAKALHAPKIVVKTAGKVVEAVISALSIWFCGKDGGGIEGAAKSGFQSGAPPPTYKQKYAIEYPDLPPNRDLCVQAQIEMKNPLGCPDPEAGCPVEPCALYGDDLTLRLPIAPGFCEDAPKTAMCYDRAASARHDCNPATRGGLTDYIFGTASVSKVYKVIKGEWIEQRDQRRVDRGSGRLRGERHAAPMPVAGDPADLANLPESEEVARANNTTEGNPCTTWQETMFLEPGDEGNPDLVEPVCTTSELDPPLPVIQPKTAQSEQVPPEGAQHVASQNAVMQVYFCAEPKEQDVPIMKFDAGDLDADTDMSGAGGEEGESSGSSEDSDGNMNPYLVEKKVYLGDGDFQMRAVIIGNEASVNRPALDAARWGVAERGKEGILEFLDKVNNLSIAQAEYYYEDPEHAEDSGIHDEWMWHMYWTARLHRFQLPSLSGDGEENGSNSSGGSSGGSGRSGGSGAGAPQAAGGSENVGSTSAGLISGSNSKDEPVAQGSWHDVGGADINACKSGAVSMNCAKAFMDPSKPPDLGGMLAEELKKKLGSSATAACDTFLKEMGAKTPMNCSQIVQYADKLGEMIGH
jgi:hypothetical protein